MSIFSELAATERYVAETEKFNLGSSISKGYRAPQAPAQLEYRPEARSNIRERVILGQLARVRQSKQDARALERFADPTLSREFREVSSQPLGLRVGAEERLLRQLQIVRAQDAAADADERAFAKLSPLQQSRTRDGFYRKGVLDRNAAIAGLLQRERRQSAPLTREAVGRAKSIDAARGMSDPYVVTDADLELAAASPLTSLAYEDYLLTEKRRRETFFAQRMIVSGGYPGVRRMKAKAIQKVSCGSA